MSTFGHLLSGIAIVLAAGVPWRSLITPEGWGHAVAGAQAHEYEVGVDYGHPDAATVVLPAAQEPRSGGADANWAEELRTMRLALQDPNAAATQELEAVDPYARFATRVIDPYATQEIQRVDLDREMAVEIVEDPYLGTLHIEEDADPWLFWDQTDAQLEKWFGDIPLPDSAYELVEAWALPPRSGPATPVIDGELVLA